MPQVMRSWPRLTGSAGRGQEEEDKTRKKGRRGRGKAGRHLGRTEDPTLFMFQEQNTRRIFQILRPRRKLALAQSSTEYLPCLAPCSTVLHSSTVALKHTFSWGARESHVSYCSIFPTFICMLLQWQHKLLYDYSFCVTMFLLSFSSITHRS